MSDPREELVERAVSAAAVANIDRRPSGFPYCYGCPHDLDVAAFLADLREDGFCVVPRQEHERLREALQLADDAIRAMSMSVVSASEDVRRHSLKAIARNTAALSAPGEEE